ncbi:MAG: hypothetical protein WKG07_19020 [Hymenobacter sp.]
MSVEDDQDDVRPSADYTFFNPKAGATVALWPRAAALRQLRRGPARARARRLHRPSRPATPAAQAERLHDLEAGYRLNRTGPEACSRPRTAAARRGQLLRHDLPQPAGSHRPAQTTWAPPLAPTWPAATARGVELTGFASANDKISLSSTAHAQPQPHPGLPRRDV